MEGTLGNYHRLKPMVNINTGAVLKESEIDCGGGGWRGEGEWGGLGAPSATVTSQRAGLDPHLRVQPEC